jgi:hypothetical protein
LQKIIIKDIPVTSTFSDGLNKPFFEVYRVNGLQESKLFDNRDDE